MSHGIATDKMVARGKQYYQQSKLLFFFFIFADIIFPPPPLLSLPSPFETCRLPYNQILRGHKDGRPNSIKNIFRRQFHCQFTRSYFSLTCLIQRCQLTKNLFIKMKIVMESGSVGMFGLLVDLKLPVW